jgi:predicted XRE-type DNA-binding protein
MSDQTQEWHVTPIGGNVFSDLGFGPEEASALKAKSDRIIMEKLAIKEALMDQLSAWMTEHHLKQIEAASILGITRPRVSDMLKKKVAKFSIDALIDMVTRTGKQVTLSFR